MWRLDAAASLSLALLAVASCRPGSEPPPSSTAPATRSPKATPTARAQAPLFTDVSDHAGVDFMRVTGLSGAYFVPEEIGAGVALFDYDGDRDLDIYLVNGARRTAAGAAVNTLYRQDDGRFTDVTGASGLGDAGYGMGVAVGDADNDGDADVDVSNYGADRLYRNRGDGTFADVTGEAGTDNPAWGSSACFLDYDRDGWLDLFVANYLDYDPTQRCTGSLGEPSYCTPASFAGVADVLFHNDGDGSFTDVTAAVGIGTRRGRGLGVACADFTGDGRADIYVANDGDANFLWVNLGDGSFAERAVELGAAFNQAGAAEAGMGVAAGDVDGDLDLDLFVTHLANESNTLYRNDGADGFGDWSAGSGLAVASLPYTGFGTALIDFDHDGDLDVIAVNGRVFRMPGAPLRPGVDGFRRDYGEPNQLFEQIATGRFVARTRDCGRLCSDVEVSRGLATGDLDGDGDLDLVVSNGNGPARVLRNDAAKAGHYLLVRRGARPRPRCDRGAGDGRRRRAAADARHQPSARLPVELATGRPLRPRRSATLRRDRAALAGRHRRAVRRRTGRPRRHRP